jgi:hypothetical protein
MGPHDTIAFPGHAASCLRSRWTLARWRSLARIVAREDHMTSIAFPGDAGRHWALARWRSLARIVAREDQ